MEDRIQRFKTLFSGFTKAFGTYDPNGLGGSGKHKPRQWKEDSPPCMERFESHLNGKKPVGIYPLDDDEMVRFAAIDIDVYPVEHSKISQQLNEWGLPFVVCNSKSDGAHAYVFFDQQEDPGCVIAELRKVSAALGYPNAEIFPKQVKRGAKGYASFINLPFFGHPKLSYNCWDGDEQLDLDGFLALAESRVTNLAALSAAIAKADLLNEDDGGSKHLPFAGLIPDGQRNNTLFKEAVSLASKRVSPDVVAQHVLSRLQDCEGDFPISEAEHTLANGLATGATNAPPFTDLGNAERFATDHADVALYCTDQRTWYCWDDVKWVPDTARVQQLAKQTTRNMLVEPSYSDEHRSALKKWQHTSESSSRQKAMIELAASEERLVKQSTDLDQHLHLFNAADGTIDLRSGEIRNPDRSDLITCVANASVRTNTTCPRWIQFINEIMCGDQAQIAYLQRLCGYMMFGDRGEQIIVYLQGDGANGKSVFIDVLSHVFGDYAATISAKALIDRASGAIPSDIASIAGKRLVTMSEFPERIPINTTTVKSVTGGDRITARHLYKDWFEFRPQFQLVCAMNELPKVTETDEAYLRRVRIIPFLRVFSPDEMDRNLQDKLKAEADGILQWCLEGARLYQEQSLQPTARMVEEWEEYRRKSDPVAEFIRECVTTEGGDIFHSVTDLVKLARKYMIREEMTIPDEAAIKKSLARILGETKQRRMNYSRVRGYIGLKVSMPEDDDVPF
jgi:putative DNA primase/helicase